METIVRLANKTAFITGGNSGIGLATARLFVAEGARVAITGRNQATLEAAAKELGPNGLALVADATDIAATEKAIKQAVEKFGKLDIVFANAGIPGNTPIGGTTLAAFEQVIRTNITSVFFTVQAAAPHLNDGASIILNTSQADEVGLVNGTVYAADRGTNDVKIYTAVTTPDITNVGATTGTPNGEAGSVAVVGGFSASGGGNAGGSSPARLAPSGNLTWLRFNSW